MSSIFDPTASGDKLQPAALAVNLGTNIGLSLITLGAFCWLRPRNGGNVCLPFATVVHIVSSAELWCVVPPPFGCLCSIVE